MSWIQACIQNFKLVLYSLINGSPSHWIPASRGLRQGCPLSPYLFIICSEVLFKVLYFAIQHQLLRVYKSLREVLVVSHLFFADDCLLVARATVKDVACLKAIFDTYYEISGQSINVSKSQIQISPKTPNYIKTRILHLTHMNSVLGS